MRGAWKVGGEGEEEGDGEAVGHGGIGRTSAPEPSLRAAAALSRQCGLWCGACICTCN